MLGPKVESSRITSSFQRLRSRTPRDPESVSVVPSGGVREASGVLSEPSSSPSEPDSSGEARPRRVDLGEHVSDVDCAVGGSDEGDVEEGELSDCERLPIFGRLVEPGDLVFEEGCDDVSVVLNPFEEWGPLVRESRKARIRSGTSRPPEFR